MTNQLIHRIDLLVQLGAWLTNFLNGRNQADPLASELESIIAEHTHSNIWFASEQIRFALTYWSNHLNTKELGYWAQSYPALNTPRKPLDVLVITAGNIPLAGFHDFVSVFLSGHTFHASLSSKDNRLLPHLIKVLIALDPECQNRLFFESSSDLRPHRLISAGSNNTARFLEYTYGNIPKLIRKNRTSVAILSGTESEADLHGLADDLSQYFGLGCRSVSKIYLRDLSQLDQLAVSLNRFLFLMDNDSFRNNHKYQNARNHILGIPGKPGGPFIFVPNTQLNSPVSVIHFEEYSHIQDVVDSLEFQQARIQCVVGKPDRFKESTPFGNAQNPDLWEYADQIDTINFLIR